MNRDTAVTTWREVCGSDTMMAMPPTGRLLEEFARRIEAATLAAFVPLRAHGVLDADDNLDCWDTPPFDLARSHVEALNAKDPAAMWRVAQLYVLGPNVRVKPAPAVGRQAPATKNVHRTCGRGLVPRRWGSA